MRRSAMRSAHGILATMMPRAMPGFVLFIIAGGLLAVTTGTSAGSLWSAHGVDIKAGALVVACVAIALLLAIGLLFNRLRRRSRLSAQIPSNEDQHVEPWI